MRYFKTIFGEYILSVGMGNGGEAITVEEYRTTLDTIRNKPTPPAGFGYRLKADLTWELYQLSPEDPDPELTADEALSVIMGGNI